MLTLLALEDNIVFFYLPSDLGDKDIGPAQRIRVGGLVEEGSLIKNSRENLVTFRITDKTTNLTTHYQGILPDLFREGQGVVAEGFLANDGTFNAKIVLAKHDETYMPPEVAKALKEKGVHETKP